MGCVIPAVVPHLAGFGRQSRKELADEKALVGKLRTYYQSKVRG